MKPSWLIRLLAKLGFSNRLSPHEKARIGLGNWGRQEAKAKLKATMKIRVFRAATGKWEDM